MSNRFSQLLPEVISIVRDAGDFIKAELGKVNENQIEAKDLNSLVSYVDKEAENLLVSQLGQLIPDSGFVTEEDTIDDTTKEHIWIIDPLDGTTNFLKQIPHFCVSVALEVDGAIEIGVIYNIMQNEMFSAVKGHGAFMNEKPISVSKTVNFNEAIIATGFPYKKLETESFIQVIQKLLVSARGLRRLGAAALDMAYVACGRLDGYYECCLNPWDVSAGILIVQEAGGILSDFDGKSNYKSGKEMVAGSPAVHKELVNILVTSKRLNTV